jgi:hypothetical protein
MQCRRFPAYTYPSRARSSTTFQSPATKPRYDVQAQRSGRQGASPRRERMQIYSADWCRCPLLTPPEHHLVLLECWRIIGKVIGLHLFAIIDTGTIIETGGHPALLEILHPCPASQHTFPRHPRLESRWCPQRISGCELSLREVLYPGQKPRIFAMGGLEVLGPGDVGVFKPIRIEALRDLLRTLDSIRADQYLQRG